MYEQLTNFLINPPLACASSHARMRKIDCHGYLTCSLGTNPLDAQYNYTRTHDAELIAMGRKLLAVYTTNWSLMAVPLCGY
jgi:hypothetical protein